MASCRSATHVVARAAAGMTSFAHHFLSSCVHCAIAAVSLGAALCRHFEYFWSCDALGLPPLEPPGVGPLEPLDPEPPSPPSPPPSPPSCCCSSEIGRAFAGGVIFCGSPTFAKSIEKLSVPPSAPWNFARWSAGIWKSTDTDSRRILLSLLPT